jgi:hypothetical protein
MDKDPLTLLNNELQKILRESVAIRAIIGPATKNIEAFNELPVDAFDVNSESDVPSFRLEPAGGPTNLHYGSNVIRFDYSYNLLLNTGDKRITEQLNPIVWALMSTLLLHTTNSPLTALSWRNSKGYVKKLNLSQVTTVNVDAGLNLGITGWTAVLALNFLLLFSERDMLDFAKGII